MRPHLLHRFQHHCSLVLGVQYCISGSWPGCEEPYDFWRQGKPFEKACLIKIIVPWQIVPHKTQILSLSLDEDRDSLWGNMDQTIARWQHLAASSESLNILYWSMCFVSHQHSVAMPVEKASQGGAFFSKLMAI